VLLTVPCQTYKDCSSAITQTGEETFFKIKKTTKMSKVFETYAQRKGVQSTSLRFLLDGERIEGDATPKMLELDDQDQIDCMLEQTGGK
jgi:small ubiquitin-related modifier